VNPVELDEWLPAPTVRTRHSRSARAEADRLWDAAAGVRLDEAATVGRLVRWRLPGTPATETFRGLLSTEPFIVLDEGEHWSLSGMCGRIWTLSHDYPTLRDADEFRTWDAPGTVRVLMAHWVQPAGADESELFSEARVEPTDRRAALALRSLWLMVGVFERLIGAEALTLAARRAEGRT
jgi:hypothetical protein